jgi:hypothetical protein
MILTEEFAVDLDMFVLGKADCLLFITCKTAFQLQLH